MESLWFNCLPITNDVFKSIIKLYLFNLYCSAHFFLLSEHSIYLNISIFIREFIRTEELFIINICLFWVLSTIKNCVSLHLFFLNYRFPLIVIKDSSHYCPSSLVCCIRRTKENSKLIRIILKSAYMGFSLIFCFDEQLIIILIFIIYYRSITPRLPVSRFLDFRTLRFIFYNSKFLCYWREGSCGRTQTLYFRCEIFLILVIQRIKDIFILIVALLWYSKLLHTILIVLNLCLLYFNIWYFRVIKVFVDLVNDIQFFLVFVNDIVVRKVYNLVH